MAQQALDVASKNISNASTVGYTRKVLPQENLIIAGQGVGARGLASIRNVNTSLIADLNKQTGVTEAYNVRLKYLDRIQDFHGASDAGRSLSAQVTSLASAFTNLSAAPNDITLLNQTLASAQQTASNINDFADLLNGMRSDAEADITSAVNEVNQALVNISDLNQTIGRVASTGQSTADLEDQRDSAIRTVAKYMDITTYPSDKAIIVITRQGQTLADNDAHPLFFQSSAMLPDSSYPGGGLGGLHVDGAGGPDITQTDIGGQLGALFNLRDSTLPQYQAQLDEFSQRLAQRFDAEGLKLFVGPDGNVPNDDPNSSVPTGYIGFSGRIQVNNNIVVDPTLLRSGTTGNTELSGSNEVIRRVVQFAFGAYQSQKAEGSLNISALTPLTQGRVGTVDLSAYAASDFSSPALAGATLPGSFDITLGANTQTINVLGTDTALTLTNKINAAFGSTVANFDGTNLALNYAGTITLTDGGIGLASVGFAAGATTAVLPIVPRNTVVGTVNIASYTSLGGVPTAGAQMPGTFTLTIGGVPKTITVSDSDTAAGLAANINTAFGYTVASINSQGMLNLSSTSDIGIAAGTIDASGLTALGLSTGTVTQPSPSFQVQVGTRAPIKITIDPGDTSADLVNKLNNNVPGLTASLNVDGELLLVPTDGGDLKLIDGPSSPLSTLGMAVTNVAQQPFRQTNLGPDGNISTGLMGNSTLQDFMSSIISVQSEEESVVKNGQAQETSFLQTLQSRNDNTSGVNIDQEMADLIRIQSAYSAAAKMISSAQQIFDELLNAIR